MVWEDGGGDSASYPIATIIDYGVLAGAFAAGDALGETVGEALIAGVPGFMAGVPWWKSARHLPSRMTQIVVCRSIGSFGFDDLTT